jgi:long-subunit fatty acid transport protein
LIRRRTAVGLLLCCAVIVGSGTSYAQSSAEANGGLYFNFGSPGARSLGFGGAFVAIADDATAVFINPAGLTQILRKEVALEGRLLSYTNTYALEGRASGQPTQRGADTIAGVTDGQTTDRLSGFTFASVVLPHDRWSFALFRHELANFRASSQTNGVFFEITKFNRPTTSRLFPTVSDLRLRIVSYGGSLAYQVTDNVSIGIAAVREEASLDSLTTFFQFHDDNVNLPADFAAPHDTQSQHGREADLVLNGGVLWHLTDALALGASYQAGNDFHVSVIQKAPGGLPADLGPGEFHVPAIYRAGVSYQFRHYTTFSTELDHIRYSDLTHHILVIDGEPNLYRADDGTEIHVGIQRLLVADPILSAIGHPLILSIGGWRDPDHQIRYLDQSSPRSIRFPKGRSIYHGTAGLGIAVGERYEVAAAYDYSSRQRTASISMVRRF